MFFDSRLLNAFGCNEKKTTEKRKWGKVYSCIYAIVNGSMDRILFPMPCYDPNKIHEMAAMKLMSSTSEK